MVVTVGKRFFLALFAIFLIANIAYFFIVGWKIPSGAIGWGQYGGSISAALTLYLVIISTYFYFVHKHEDRKSHASERAEEARSVAKEKIKIAAHETIASYRKEVERFVSIDHREGREAFKQFREDLLEAIAPFILSVNGHIPQKLRNQYSAISNDLLTIRYPRALPFINSTIKSISDLEGLQRKCDENTNFIDQLKLEIKQDELLVFLCWYITDNSSPETRTLIRNHKLLSQCTIKLPNTSILDLTQSTDVTREMSGRLP